MYRSRLGSDIDRTTLDYLSSISEDTQIMPYDIACSQAHTIMLHDQQIISRDDARRILEALKEVSDRGPDEASKAEDIHEYIEAEVVSSAGMDSGGKMQTGRSRNDQVSCDIRMKIRDDINLISLRLLDLVETLLSLASAHKKTVMPLYTHLQRAQAGTFSHYALSCADILLRDLGRLSAVYERVNQNPLGSGPVGGTSINIDRKITTELLGFDGVVDNSIDATSSRDCMAEYVSALSILMTGLSRMAEDFVLWSTDEFGFIEISDELASPSSIMPQKKNPDIMELTRGKAADVIGCLVSVLSASKGLATGYGRDLQQAKQSVWRASVISIGAATVMRSVLLTLTVNKKQMKKAAEKSYVIALDIAEELVRQGIPFRQAHQISGRLVQAAHDIGKPLSKLDISQIRDSLAETGAEPGAVADILAQTTLSSSLKSRISQGSSGFAQQTKMIRSRKTAVSKMRKGITDRDLRVAGAFDRLARRVSEITG